MNKIAYDKERFIKTKHRDENIENEIENILCLNGIWKNGRFIADTSTELVKGRKDTYLRYKRFVKKLSNQGICTSARIKKKIREIETEQQRQEYHCIF